MPRIREKPEGAITQTGAGLAGLDGASKLAGGKAKGSVSTSPDEATPSGRAADSSAGEPAQPSSAAGDSSKPLAANGKPLGWSFLPREQDKPQEAEATEPASQAPTDNEGVSALHFISHHCIALGTVV